MGDVLSGRYSVLSANPLRCRARCWCTSADRPG